ncbi:hypothetical protein BD311DRAFT_812336 [Dichomitus squalens]|uniref:Ubinuclein middle domain-containing protein n=1 Tax=Dichomitus squalens TaxID=114155 RepID=A0A4Q9M705_9APHY|nr:hypothetical protein BD311DRAFT_812336 [Dichomitus squalens]
MAVDDSSRLQHPGIVQQVSLPVEGGHDRRPSSSAVAAAPWGAKLDSTLSLSVLPPPSPSKRTRPVCLPLRTRRALDTGDEAAVEPELAQTDGKQKEKLQKCLRRPTSILTPPASTPTSIPVPSGRDAQHLFHLELEQVMEVLKEAVAKENREAKSKFPPGMKPTLAQVALKAVILVEYDHNFNLMPRLFPFKDSAMIKIVEARSLRRSPNGIGHSSKRSSAPGNAQATPMMPRTPLGQAAIAAAEDGEHENGAGSGGRAQDTHLSAKRYGLTDQMRTLIWQLACLNNECCQIENKNRVALEGSNQILVTGIIVAFPDGWLSSRHIWREVSVMKKYKEAMDND